MTETKPGGTPSNPNRIRSRLNELEGKRYWRSLEELAESDGFQEFLAREFPENVTSWTDPVGRRNFLRLMGASMALAGIGACTKQPSEKILPYVRQPEEIVPGRPLYFATAMPQGGYGHGLLVESHMGRPTKAEGNPEHPASLGSTNVFSQATVLSLYSPDRSRGVRKAGRISTWDIFLAEIAPALETQRGRQGEGLRILTETVTSPTLARQISRLLERLPRARWHQWEPAGQDGAREGAQLAFGEDVQTLYRFDRAKVVLSLDADFLYWGPGCVRYSRDFADARRVTGSSSAMNRLYVVESGISATGAVADHRLAIPPAEILSLAMKLAQETGLNAFETETAHARWVSAAARDLMRHRGESIVIAGDEQPAFLHALAHALNAHLGNVGSTVSYTEPVESSPVNQTRSLQELVADMKAARVELLLILGGNPVYNAPADLGFGDALEAVPLRIRLGLAENETSDLCHWHLPEAHFLESWGDVRAFEGTTSIIQPLIAPLFGGHSALEMLSVFLGEPGRTSYEIVRDYWRERADSTDFERFWRQSVHDGVVPEPSPPVKSPSLVPNLFSLIPQAAPARERDLQIVFRPDPGVWDGRFSNNAWLQELPRPLTKLTWDNAAIAAPGTAARLGLNHGDVVTLSLDGRSLEAPLWIQPGQARDTILVHLGYGRTRAGQVGNGVGFDAYALRSTGTLWSGSGLGITATGRIHEFASTQNHHLIHVATESEQAGKRHLVREVSLVDFLENPDLVREMGHEFDEDYTLLPPHEYSEHSWGMTIDLNACTGCNACVVACQSENNIPVVGKSEVVRGREMHWIRIDRYFEGSLDHPRVVHQPVMCHHCENAPCEVVCPVAATSHSDEGLNEMTYNRCVGTRYCSNNCPYKVRRFNFYLYQDWDTPTLKLLRNPDVTVRSRGVMEKCTYCVQRISAARITARNEDRPIRDGEVRTACEAVCPTQAIRFGNLNDPNSRVSILKTDKRNYGILAELNTRPRTTYLARLRNPNPEIPHE